PRCARRASDCSARWWRSCSCPDDALRASWSATLRQPRRQPRGGSARWRWQVTRPESCAEPDSRKPGRPRSADADRAIIEATLELLVESGAAAMAIEHVAARAGVSKATIYRRWPNK